MHQIRNFKGINQKGEWILELPLHNKISISYKRILSWGEGEGIAATYSYRDRTIISVLMHQLSLSKDVYCPIAICYCLIIYAISEICAPL